MLYEVCGNGIDDDGDGLLDGFDTGDCPPPVATNDAYTIDEDTQLSVLAPGVLANDVGTGTTPTAVLVTGPNHAAAFVLNADGSFSYTPEPGFSGSDSFV